MNVSNEIADMLKEHGISESFYIKFRENDKLDNDEYDRLALEYNAPLGKSWEEIAQDKYNYNTVTDNPNTIEKRNYHSTIRFGMGCAVYLENEEDELFFNELPDTFDEYLKLSFEIKSKMVNICKKQILHIEICENNGAELYGEVEILRKAKEQSVDSLIRDSEKQIEEFKSWREKKDYPTYWECALDIRLKIVTGDGLSKDMEIYDGYRWAVENCTVKGESIPSWLNLKNGYENAKERNRASIKIYKFEEDYYE